MTYRYNAPWHPLKKICLGRSYNAGFYQDIRNSQIRDILTRIAEETEQDYQNIQTILLQAGCEVVRPVIQSDSIMNHIDNHGRVTHTTAKSYTLIPRPPMQPRDCQLIIDNTFIATNSEISFYQDLLSTDQIIKMPLEFDAPYVTVIGRDLIVDRRDCPGLDSLIRAQFPDHRVTAVDIGGHNDAVFAPIAPGIIISTYYHDNYSQTFPGWKVLYIENQSWNAIPAWRKLKHNNAGKWWMPGEEHNIEFTQFVETWLTNWVGQVEETVFDVNMLAINDRLVLVNNYNQQVFDFLKQHGIEAIVAPFRHRFFWDGGIHCITSDLVRDGEPEYYIRR
jgi:hypothetical protein